jgi:hypothetical protein
MPAMTTIFIAGIDRFWEVGLRFPHATRLMK